MPATSRQTALKRLTAHEDFEVALLLFCSFFSFILSFFFSFVLSAFRITFRSADAAAAAAAAADADALFRVTFVYQ